MRPPVRRKSRKPFRLVRRSNSPPASASAFPASSASSEATGTCSAGAAFSLPSEASPACTSAPSSISGASRLCSCFPRRFFFRLRRSGPTSVILRRIAAACFEAPLDILKVSPVKALFSGAGTCVLFPFAVASVCSGVSRKGCTPSTAGFLPAAFSFWKRLPTPVRFRVPRFLPLCLSFACLLDAAFFFPR